jgi:succinyl-diaminopimelate desuccinylase
VAAASVGPTAVLARLDSEAEELAALTLELSRLPDRSGFERSVAEAVAGWFGRAGIDATVDPISATSANVAASVGGSGEEIPALILSSHLDTEGADPVGAPELRERLRGAWRDGDVLIGKGVVNNKTQLAAMMVAMRAVAQSGPELRHRLSFLGTAQECGAPFDPSLVPRRDEAPHMGEGFGARVAVERGLAGGSALVGEPTGFGICGAQAGYVMVRVTVPGVVPYTPFVARGGPLANPFERSAQVVTRLTEWASRYAERERFEFWGGTVAPKAQIQDIRRSAPLFTQLDDACDVFLDIRTAPGRDDASLLAELRDVLRDLPFESEITPIDRATGHVATGAEGLVAAVEAAHRAIFGRPPAPPPEAHVSMWHDSNAFNAGGIPAISYGIAPRPEPYTRERIRSATVADLARLAQVYALTALTLCTHDARDGG